MVNETRKRRRLVSIRIVNADESMKDTDLETAIRILADLAGQAQAIANATRLLQENGLHQERLTKNNEECTRRSK
jgi:hypothetical protein